MTFKSKTLSCFYIFGHGILQVNLLQGIWCSFNNYKLHVIDGGKGDPTVIIEAGIKCPTSVYDTLRMLISEFNRVISCDHAGIGFSTRSPEPRTLQNYIKRASSILDKKKLILLYTYRAFDGWFYYKILCIYISEEVAGLVFIDQPRMTGFEYIRTTHSPADVSKLMQCLTLVRPPFIKGFLKKNLKCMRV